ncbi:MAG TPA: YceI family protein [Acidimicrobiales bacterium]|nr:YceI family protein [Acidimicrobiales bacterium]
MSTAETSVAVPSGTWELDPAHSSINFSVRHLRVSKVRGRFTSFTSVIKIDDDPLKSEVDVTIDAASIDTRDEQRDAHLRSPDFLDVEKWPTLTFKSTAVRHLGGSRYEIQGHLTVKDVTRPVTLEAELQGIQPDPWGNTRMGFEARTEINRKDFGLTWNMPLEGGGVVVGDKVTIEIEVEAVLKK